MASLRSPPAVIFVLAVACGAGVALPSRAQADGGGATENANATAKADALFAEGRALMDRGELATACEKLEESFQLSPRLGTMLNLGACVERRGELARALGIYERAATMAREAGRPNRERTAREMAASVEARVGKLLVVVGEPTQGLVIDVDGVPAPARGDLLAVDPGDRRVTARAPGKKPWTSVVTSRPGATLRVVVPRLEPEEAAAPRASPPPPHETETTEPASPVRTAAIAGGFVLAAAGIGVGTAFGLRAKSKHDASDAHCDAIGCDPDGLALISAAKTAGTVSTVAFAVGGAGLVTALAVLLFTPARRPASGTVSVRAGRADLGLDLGVDF